MRTLRRIKELIEEAQQELLIPRGQFSIPRHQMPQISQVDREEYFDLLRMRGITVVHKYVLAKDLRAAQNEIDEVRVREWIKHMPHRAEIKPCLVSIDNYVLDGNHTWLAFLNRDPYSYVGCCMIGLNFQDLINTTRLFDKVTNKTIKEENTNV